MKRSSSSTPTQGISSIDSIVTRGAPGAPGYPDSTNPGASVPYPFEISRHAITNEQYAAFLNAVAADDPNGLSFSSMQTNSLGGIERTGTAGSGQKPVKSGGGQAGQLRRVLGRTAIRQRAAQ